MSFFDKIAAQIPFARKQEEKEYLFALNLGLSSLRAAVWALSGKQLEILGQSQVDYDKASEIVDAANTALDQALGPLDVDPKRILFGVPDSWTSDDDLKEEFLKVLKDMLKEFELEPLAYVTTSHAIVHYLQKKDGVPPTAVIVGVGTFLEVALSRGGKVIVSKALKRSDRLFEDLEKILTGFNEVEVLPSKILVYATHQNVNLPKVKDELMSYPWMSKLPFLHFPKVEVLAEMVASEALVLAGAVEIDPKLSVENIKLNLPSKSQDIPSIDGQTLKQIKEGKGETGFVAGNIKEKVDPKPSAKVAGKKLKRYPKSQEFEVPHRPSEPGASQEVEDIEGDRLQTGRDSEEEFFSPLAERESQPYLPEESSKIAAPKVGLWLPASIALFLNSFKSLLSHKLMVIPIFVVLLLAAYIFLVKASVTVFVEPKVLEKEAEVVADPSVNAVDQDREIIPGSIVETTETGSDKALASGSKQIGDPAKGQVVIYNKTNNPLSLSQGATFLGNSNLKFTLDTSVQVASQSGGTDASQETIPGTSPSEGITAVAIGPDSNLPAGTSLSVSSYSQSDVVAKVLDNGLTGGTSKTVTVVTDDDQKKLEAQVIDNLKRQAANDLQGQVEDKKVIPEALTAVDGKYSFSKRVGDQATDFNLDATVHFKGTAYSETDLRSIVGKLVETDVPDGFAFNLQDSETGADVERVDKNGKLYFMAKFKANLLPVLDENNIKNLIKGKSVAQATDALKNLNNVVGAEIVISPGLPSPLNKLYRLPLLTNNIKTTITTK